MKYERFRAACAAMQSLLIPDSKDRIQRPHVLAKTAVQYADALLEQLYEKKKPANQETGIQNGNDSRDRSTNEGQGLPRTSPGVAVESKSPGA